MSAEASPVVADASLSPVRRPPTPGNTEPLPAAVDPFSQGIVRVDVPPRNAPPARSPAPLDQLRSLPALIPRSADQPLPDPSSPLRS